MEQPTDIACHPVQMVYANSTLMKIYVIYYGNGKVNVTYDQLCLDGLAVIYNTLKNYMKLKVKFKCRILNFI